jgi:hypothetical protein
MPGRENATHLCCPERGGSIKLKVSYARENDIMAAPGLLEKKRNL